MCKIITNRRTLYFVNQSDISKFVMVKDCAINIYHHFEQYYEPKHCRPYWLQNYMVIGTSCILIYRSLTITIKTTMSPLNDWIVRIRWMDDIRVSWCYILLTNILSSISWYIVDPGTYLTVSHRYINWAEGDIH